MSSFYWRGACTVSTNASWVVVTWNHQCEQTDACENITFLQLLWRVVNIIKFSMMPSLNLQSELTELLAIGRIDFQQGEL